MLSKTGQPRRIKGFTLIEGMITVALVAIIAALAAPGMQTLISRFQLQAASDAVMSGLQLARSEALRRNQPVRFSLVAGSSGWSVTLVGADEALQSHAGVGAPSLIVETNDDETDVVFLPTGLVDTSEARLERIDLSSSAEGVRPARILIAGGGKSRACDPSIDRTGDPLQC